MIVASFDQLIVQINLKNLKLLVLTVLRLMNCWELGALERFI